MSDSKQFLTLEEVAEQLGVNYQLIYKLVRSGELPAIKIGRVYRVSKGDLEVYLQQSRVTKPTGFGCVVCGNRYESRLSIGGYSSKTGSPICVDCWTRKGVRHE